MKDLINRVFEEKMQDGTVEKIVSENIDNMIKEICKSQMNWNGAAKKAMEEKLSPIILQAVESSDLSNMVTKITMLINSSLQASELEDYHDVLESVRSIYGVNDHVKALRERKVVKLSEIFEEYKKYLNDIYDRDDFDSEDITDDGEGVTSPIDCYLTVAPEEGRFTWQKPGYEVELSTDKSNDKKSGDVRFKLKWNYDNSKLHLYADLRSLSLSDLRYCPSFILYLAAIEREWSPIEIDIENDDDVVYIDCRE